MPSGRLWVGRHDGFRDGDGVRHLAAWRCARDAMMNFVSGDAVRGMLRGAMRGVS
jgi:hypothetical protein